MFPLILFLSLITINNISATGDELVAVSLLYRHGDRAPLSFYPKDPYKNSSVWSATPGELTNIGKKQMYELGRWLRNRYNGFLSPIYNKREIYVRSSDDDRCFMSAATKLAGLYPPQGKDNWNSDLPWQPVPIHSIPEEADDIAEVEKACPKYLDLFWKNAEEHPYSRELNEKYKSLYQLLTLESGRKIKEIEDANDLFDILSIEKSYNLTLPQWAIENYSQLEEIGDVAYKLFTLTPKLTKLFVGRYFDNLIQQFQFFSNDDSKEPNGKERKFKTFSLHDIQVYGVLDALQVDNLKKIPYAATILFELWRNRDESLYVKVFYKTKSDIADKVRIKGCKLNCEFAKFKEIISRVSITKLEYEKECR